MVTTIPDTTDLLSDEILDGLSMGTLQALQLRLVQRVQAKITAPTAYEEFARHDPDNPTDWGTNWHTEQSDSAPETADQSEAQEFQDEPEHKPQQPFPSPPHNYFETLPGIVDTMVSTRRVQDAIVATLTGFADRAYDLDRDSVLGIPANVNLFKTGKRWLADRFQVDARQMGKFYARAELIAPEQATIAGIGRQPLLPKLARAYAAGAVPSENVDRMSQIAKHFFDFYDAVGLTKENATEILQTMDPVFTDAAQRMTSQQLAQESAAWLNQIAHMVAPDGPPPDECGTKKTNSLHTRIINGKLHISIVTDVVNLELIEALVLAGLNFKAHQDKFRQTADPEQTGDAETHDDSSGSAERLRSFHQQMDDATDDPETFVETEEGKPVSRAALRTLDPRSRAHKAHDVFITMLKAQGKRSPGADGMPQYKRAPAILWTVMDYETLLRMQQDRIDPRYHLAARYQRQGHIIDTGPPATFDPDQPLADEYQSDTASALDSIFGAEPVLRLRWPRDTRAHDPPHDEQTAHGASSAQDTGHPYVSHRFQTGSVSPAAVLQDLCDAKVIPAIFDQAGVPLFLGRGKRTFSDDQILAAGMRGGCRGPGCRVPPVWTQGHHAQYWTQDGVTDTTNLILLCNACHTQVHQGTWTPTWNTDGVLYWIPAPWLDPTQTPVRNTYWDT